MGGEKMARQLVDAILAAGVGVAPAEVEEAAAAAVAARRGRGSYSSGNAEVVTSMNINRDTAL